MGLFEVYFLGLCKINTPDQTSSLKCNDHIQSSKNRERSQSRVKHSINKLDFIGHINL